jgi:hypothetical protein
MDVNRNSDARDTGRIDRQNAFRNLSMAARTLML